MFELCSASGLTIFEDELDTRMFSIPKFSTRSSSRIDRSLAFLSRMFAAFADRSGSCPVIFFRKMPALEVRKLVNEVSVSWKCSVGDELPVGELQGVTVGEKFTPEGVLRQLGVTALIPRSFNMEANPKLTENVLQEFLLERFLGVGGQVVCRDSIRDDICEGGKLKVILDVPSSGCITQLLV